MAEKQMQAGNDLEALARGLLLDIPFAAAKLPLGDSKELETALWKSYDAWVRLTTNSINALYGVPAVGDTVGNSLKGMLRLQRYTNALTGTLFAGLWPALGLPSNAEFRALRDEVQTLADE